MTGNNALEKHIHNLLQNKSSYLCAQSLVPQSENCAVIAFLLLTETSITSHRLFLKIGLGLLFCWALFVCLFIFYFFLPEQMSSKHQHQVSYFLHMTLEDATC